MAVTTDLTVVMTKTNIRLAGCFKNTPQTKRQITLINIISRLYLKMPAVSK